MRAMPPAPRPSSMSALAALTLTAALTAACGGGGGGDAPTPAPPAPSPSPSPTPTPPAPSPSPTPAPPAPAPIPAPPPPNTPAPPAPGPSPAAGPMLGSCPSFPATAVFNTRIDDTARFPAHARNAEWIAAIGATVAFHADWGVNDNPGAADYYGIPWNLLGASNAETDWPSISFTADGAPDESDCAVARAGGGWDIAPNCASRAPAALRFPFPRDNVIKLEGGTCNDPGSCGDRHVLTVEQGACRLWESFYTYKIGGQWTAYSTAAWDLNSNAMRPDSWTSGDAAGLPITPLLARAGEASTGEIRHALRVTFRDSVLAAQYVWPARHRAGGSTGGIPFGALLRLKSSFVIPSTWNTQARALATAMQRYGLYVSDIGSNLYVQGDPNSQWSSATITQIQGLRMSDFEFVDNGAITRDSRFNANSFQGSW